MIREYKRIIFGHNEFKKPDEGGEYGDGNNYSKEELRKMVNNYPKMCIGGWLYEEL